MLVRVDLDVRLLGMLAPPCGGHAGHGALEDLEQRLLHALTGDVARDRDVAGRAADLVDLVDVDDALLGPLDVEVGRLQELEQDVLDVLADVARPRSASWRRPSRTGTSSMRARVRARRVLPDPVGPTRRTLDFASISTSSFWVRRS